jgi:hypothetical protein
MRVSAPMIVVLLLLLLLLLMLLMRGERVYLNKHKLHFCTSMVTILLSIVTLLLMVTGEETILTCSFFLYVLFIMLLTANLASYVTVLWCHRKQLKRRDLIYTCVFLVVNMLFLLLYLYLITLFYFFN